MSDKIEKIYNPDKDDKELNKALQAGKNICGIIPKGGYKKGCDFFNSAIETTIQEPKEILQSNQKKQNNWIDEALNGDSKVNLGDTIISDNPQPQSTNSQTPTFSPKNLIESEITQINEALWRYGVADKERYLREIDDKMAVFNGYLDNRCDALEKFTKNSDISVASNDFNKAVKQQENLLKEELSFTEKYVIKDFAHKLYGVKMPETKQRIGIDAMTQHKISFLLDTVSKHKRQIVQTCGEKTWQETFENFQKTNDLKVFENALKSQNSNENVNLKNSENNITNPQENGNNFKM